MADLKIIEYTGPAKCKLQKPSSNNNRQPSCLNSNLRKIAGKMLSEALPTVGGGTGDKGCYQKTAAKDREDIPQSSNDYLIRDQRDFSNNIHSSSTHLQPLLDENILAEEPPSMETSIVTYNGRDLNSNLISAYKNSIQLDSNNRSKVDSNLDISHAYYIVPSEKLSYNAFSQEHSSRVLSCIVDEHGADDTIGITPPTIKRQRSKSLSTFIPHQLSTPPLLYSKNTKGNTEITCSNFEEPANESIYSKRRKVSISQDCIIVSYNNLPQLSQPMSDDDSSEKSEDEDSEEEVTHSISVDTRFTSSSRTTPESDMTSPIESPLCPIDTDIDQEWEVRRIIGKENIDSVLHYLVDWQPTLLPKDSLGHAKDLIDKFEASIHTPNNGQGSLGSKPEQKPRVDATVLRGQQGTKPRGRPRKQVNVEGRALSGEQGTKPRGPQPKQVYPIKTN